MIKYIVITFAWGLLSFVIGFELCKQGVGRYVMEAVDNLDKTKVIMLKAEDLLKEVEDEVHDNATTENEEE